MTKTILLATVVAVTILGLTTTSIVFNNTVEANNGEGNPGCLLEGTVFDPNTGKCIPPESCPFGVTETRPHCKVFTSEDRTPVRDNVDVENIKLKQGQYRVIVDNAGIGATSDVEITWNFDRTDCVVIAAGDVGGFGTVALTNDGAFSSLGIPVGHNDVKFAEAILLTVAPDARSCEINSSKGEFVAVSTVGMGPPGLLVTSNPTGP